VVVNRPVLTATDDPTTSPDKLARQLEKVTELGLRKIEEILQIPTDHLNGNILRAQVAGATATISAQLKADENLLRVKRGDDVLARLLKTIEEERRKLPRENRRKKIIQTMLAQPDQERQPEA
jgi:hypothetical protein